MSKGKFFSTCSKFLLLTLLYSSAAFSKLETVTECEGLEATSSKLGFEEIVLNKLYVVYSGTTINGAPGAETSNIYLIKGRVPADPAARRQVWIFGSGYGDPSGYNNIAQSDVSYYRKSKQDATRRAAVDVCYVDYVIDKKFGLADKNLVDIRFVTPHFHLDHINQEFFTGLWAKNYSATNARSYIHVVDSESIKLSCTTPCCMSQADIDAGKCKNSYATKQSFGAPYTPPWQSDVLSNLVALGSTNDSSCTVVSVSSSSPDQISGFQSALGNWYLLRGPTTHTGGPLYLRLINTAATSYLIAGVDAQANTTDICETGAGMPLGTTVYLPIHGNVSLTPR